MVMVPFLWILPTRALAKEEEKDTYDVTVALLSKYVWRGQELSRHSVVIEPSCTAAYQGFPVNVWGNMDTRPYVSGTDSYHGTWTETDVTLAYTKTLGLFILGGGYIYYGLNAPNKKASNPPDAQEIFISTSLNTMLSPTLTVYKEVDHYHQWYLLLGVTHTFALNQRFSLKLATSASYLLSTDATTYPKYNDKALPTLQKFRNFHDGTMSVQAPIKVADCITLTPMGSYVLPLSEDAKNEMRGRGISGETPGDRSSSFLYGGGSASLSF